MDHLGSPRVVTDAVGAVVGRKDFSAYGEEISTPQRVQNLGYQPVNVRQSYTGYLKDEESGLEFAEARYYNPLHGRFTSVDPLTASATIRNPQTFNRYAYALNSPYKFTDPLGLEPIPYRYGSAPGAYGCGAEYSSCDRDSVWGDTPWFADPPEPEQEENDEGAADDQQTERGDQQQAEGPAPPPADSPLSADEEAQTVIVTVNPTTEKNYAVAGETANDAIANSSITCGSTKSAGCTDWSISRSTGRVSARAEKRGKSFTATASATSKVTVDVTITLPDWSGYEKASAEEKGKWDKFISTLRKHEKGHEERAISGARSLAGSLPTSASATARTEKGALSTAVSRLNSRIVQTTNNALNSVRASQRQYDLDTDHGRKQP